LAFGSDQLTRILTNLYNKAFEQGTAGEKQNLLLTRVYSPLMSDSDERARWVPSDSSFASVVYNDLPTFCMPFDDDGRTAHYMVSAGVPRYRFAGYTDTFTYKENSVLTAMPESRFRQPSLVPGDTVGRSFQFSQSSDTSRGIDPLSDISNNSAAVSLEAVFKVTIEPSGVGYMHLLGTIFRIGIKNHRLNIVYDTTGGVNVIDGPVLDDGEPHHVIVTFDTGRNRILAYVDGVPLLPISTTTTPGLKTFALSPLHYISLAGTNQADGCIQWCSLYPYALSPAQADRHYKAFQGTATPEAHTSPAPVARYYNTMLGAQKTTDEYEYFAGSSPFFYTKDVCNTSTMWGAFRLRPAFDHATPGASQCMWSIWDSTSNNIALTYELGSLSWQIARKSGGAGAVAVTPGTHGAYEALTLAFYLTPTQIGISLNGAPWVSAANSSIPTLAVANWGIAIGNAGATYPNSNAYFNWMMLGLGPITDADIAAIHSIGDRKPHWPDIPNLPTLNPSFMWKGEKFGNHTPTGVWGESYYG